MSEKTNRILYIVLSLFVAVLFWFYVDNEQGNTVTNTITGIPIEFVGASDTLPSRGLIMIEGSTYTLDAELSGPRTVVPGLTRDDISFVVDLSSVTSVGTYPMTPKVQWPDNFDRSGIVVEKVSRSTVSVTVVEMFEKTVPVDVDVVGEIGDNYVYMAEKLVVQPSYLTLVGREEQVDEVVSARVVLDLTKANSSIRKQFDYELLDASGNVVDDSEIKVSDKRVEISVPIYVRKTLNLTVKLKESAGSRGENVDVRIEPRTIEVAGEAASLEGRKDILLDTLELSQFLSDTESEYDITLPSGCVNLSGITTANVSVKFKNMSTKAVSVTNISAIGLGEGQSFSRVTNTVDLILRGPAEELELVTPEDIRIVVDLTEYVSKGTYSVPAVVLVDGYDNVGAVGTYSVTCKITT